MREPAGGRPRDPGGPGGKWACDDVEEVMLTDVEIQIGSIIVCKL